MFVRPRTDSLMLGLMAVLMVVEMMNVDMIPPPVSSKHR